MTQSKRCIGIVDLSTTKGNSDGEQEDTKQINTHTKGDTLQRNRLVRIWVALYFSTYFCNEY